MYTYIYISCWIRFAKTYRATVDIVVSMSKLERIFAEARAIMVHYIYIYVKLMKRRISWDLRGIEARTKSRKPSQ